MYYIHHVHPASASAQSVYLPSFLPGGPCLCVVRHSTLSFVSLSVDQNEAGTEEPLRELFNVPINGRILKVERIAGNGDGMADRIGVLTDHHLPRFFVLSYTGSPTFELPALQSDVDQRAGSNASSGTWTEVKTDASITLEELGRPAAESGLTLEVEHGDGACYAFVHTHVGTLKVCRVTSSTTEVGVDLAHAFNLRTPHPHLISSTFLNRPSASSPSTVALLSLSSIASRLPGLGMQCLPVLSFHTIDEKKQELIPIPWASQAKTSTVDCGPSTLTGKQRRRSSQARSMASTSEKPPVEEKNTANARFGPAASGAVKTPEEEMAAEEALAKSPLGVSHVPLPFTDALGAHMLLPLPVRAGAGVLVFCESTILLVPPPSSTNADARRSSVRSPKLSPGKRRKSSLLANEPEATAIDGSALSTSPTATVISAPPRANENGKRRRSTASSAISTGQTTTTTPAGTERRRRSSAGFACAGRRIVRLDLPPMIVAASLVVQEPGMPGDDGVHDPNLNGESGANVKVLFATHAGVLHLLTIQLEGERSAYKPTTMNDHILGQVPAPGSQGGLTYLGEDFVHVASTGGDSVVVRLSHGAVDVVQRWPNLAPILDFVVDDGHGGNPIDAGSAQARIITCSGSGATGSLRTIRNGVTVNEIADIDHGGVERSFGIVDFNDDTTKLLVCSSRDRSRVLALDESGLEDATDHFVHRGFDREQEVLVAKGIQGDSFVVVTRQRVSVISYELSRTDVAAVWTPEEVQGDSLSLGRTGISQAAANESGQVILAFPTGHLVYLEAGAKAIRMLSVTQLECEVSALDITPLSTSDKEMATIAAVSLWKPSVVKIIKLPDLRDATPNALIHPQSALIRSVKLHIFADNGQPTSAPQLLVGLGDGTLVSQSLSMPTADSISQSIGVSEHRVATLGNRPVQLRSSITSQGLRVLLAMSDRVNVVFSRGPGLVYSAVRQENLKDTSDLVYRSSSGLERTTAFILDDAIRLVQIGEISKSYIGGTSLGHDNPLALTLCADGKAIAVVTTRFLPDGRGDDPVDGGKVLLRDLSTLDAVDEITLEDEERPNCVSSFTSHGMACLVVGTGYAFPDRTETTMGRILIIRIDAQTRKLDLIASHNVEGNVFDVAAIAHDHVVACVNAKVISFLVENDDVPMDAADSRTTKTTAGGPSSLTLRQVDQWGCAFTVTSVSHVKPDRLVVGDALRSIAVLRVDESKKLRELARDCDPYWTVACESLNEEEETYIGSDIAFNLWTCKRLKWTQAAKTRIEQNRLRESETGGASAASAAGVGLVDDTWSHIMQRDAGIHYGDLINKMRRGALTVASRETVQSRVVFGTAAGAIGVIAEVNERGGRILSQLEAKSNDAWSPVGKISADGYRTLRTDHRTQTAAGFIDGDTIRRGFESLPLVQRAKLAQGGRLPIEAGMDEVNKLVESLGRLS